MVVLVFGGFARLGGQKAIFSLLILRGRFKALDKNPLRGF